MDSMKSKKLPIEKIYSEMKQQIINSLKAIAKAWKGII
jgi:hypothetical protein